MKRPVAVSALQHSAVIQSTDLLSTKLLAHVFATSLAETLRKEMEMHADANLNAQPLLHRLKLRIALGVPPFNLMFYSQDTTGSWWNRRRKLAVCAKTPMVISTLLSVNSAQLILCHKPTGFSGAQVKKTLTGSRINWSPSTVLNTPSWTTTSTILTASLLATLMLLVPPVLIGTETSAELKLQRLTLPTRRSSE